MIKGSLLCSIPIVKRFLASKNGAKNWGFWGLGGENFNPNNQPLIKQSPLKQSMSGAKTVSIDAKMRARNPIKKFKKITAFDLHISPLCRVSCAWPIFIIFGVWGSYRRRNHPCHILSRLVKGLGGCVSRKSGVSH